jgi:tetratricopeptide (TPR) repeat protein
MSKKHKHRKRSSQPLVPRPTQPEAVPLQPRPLTPDTLAQEGLRFFKNGRYAEAIGVWEKLDLPEKKRALAAAMAEAHFRLAVGNGIGADSLPHLEHATSLAPTDPFYAYYLGLARHKQGRLAEALDAYRQAAANGLSRPGTGVVIALAALELDPNADLAIVPGVAPEDRQALEPTLLVLQGRPRVEQPGTFLGGLAERLKLSQPPPAQLVLNGLALLAEDKPEARQALTSIETRTLPRSVNAVRWYYVGVAAARAGDLASALDAWKQARNIDSHLAGLSNLSALYVRQSRSQAEAGDWAGAARSALEGHKSAPSDSTAGALAVNTLDRAAHEAIKTDDWATAAQRWAEAREVLGDLPGGSTPRPILHNLALAYEATQQWQPAAEAWRAMLRTKPRKKTLEGFSDEHWMWIRKRVIECYKQAGRPDEAITVFRQALKANPEDAEMQLDLVSALLSNEQEQAALSELRRLLKKHPNHVEAMTMLAELQTRRGEWYAAEMTMRQALDVEPDNEKLRRRMADVLIERGGNWLNAGNNAAALDQFEQAQQYVPDDYNLHFNLARAEFNLRQFDKAREYVERGLELGRDKSEAYEQAFICWAVERKLDEARAVQQRGEAAGKLTTNFYIHAGIACLERAAPEPGVPDLSFIFGGRRSKSPRSRRASRAGELNTLGKQLIEQAVALGPEADVLRHIVAELGPEGADIALPYAQRLVKVTPEDPAAWLTLGVFLGMEQQVQEGQAALRQAARLARKQGNQELAREADQMRRAIADPLLGIALQMAPLMGEFGYDFD